MSTLLRIEAVKDLVQEAVDRGTTTVEHIHKAILGVPFDALAQRGLLGEAASEVREGGERVVGSVYDVIRRVNREIGGLASYVFEAIDDQQTVQRTLAERERAKPTA